jgi:hypothetical protein
VNLGVLGGLVVGTQFFSLSSQFRSLRQFPIRCSLVPVRYWIPHRV